MADAFELPALRVEQWLRSWNDIDFDASAHRRKPLPYFYLTSIETGLLKRLTGVHQRTVGSGERVDDLGIQRRHDKGRSSEIANYVKVGFPWSELGPRQRQSAEYRDLRKPGWLPTALVVNILKPEDRRGDSQVAPADMIRIGPARNGVEVIELPSGARNPAWRPGHVAPLEIIDGQHRLWAFDESGMSETFELPVVVFNGLDISWQAYLFYTINIKPKRINRSLAYDLYPLLRTEEWLNRFEGLEVYRETRAQEITEIMWSHPMSPWRNKINMVGDPSAGGVSQATWIRALTSSLIKGWEGSGRRLGGLFGAPVGARHLALPWSRAQQAAFVIQAWRLFESAIDASEADWARALTTSGKRAMLAPGSLINTDPGVRVVLQTINDFTYLRAQELGLFSWLDKSPASEAIDLKQVSSALESANEQSFTHALDADFRELAQYDWRSSSAPGLNEDERLLRRAFRGSGGYGELRRQVLTFLAGRRNTISSGLAADVLSTLPKRS